MELICLQRMCSLGHLINPDWRGGAAVLNKEDTFRNVEGQLLKTWGSPVKSHVGPGIFSIFRLFFFLKRNWDPSFYVKSPDCSMFARILSLI